jgi:hypothetical protein
MKYSEAVMIGCAAVCNTLMLWMDGTGGLMDRIVFDRRYYAGLAVLIIVLVAVSIKAYRVWWDIQDAPEPDSPDDLLRSFEQAHSAGQLDEEEMTRVRARLSPGAGTGEIGPDAQGRDQEGQGSGPEGTAQGPPTSTP